jgi:gamma-glutamylcyclotransferase (GGCT)/AIG2-like uncharacterized protein YtfP
MNCILAEFLINTFYYQEKEQEEKEKQKADHLAHSFVNYFAYGSLMDQTAIEEKIGPVEFVGKAALHGFQLSFAKLPLPCRAVRVTILPNYHAMIEGAVYKINRLQLALLDQGKGINVLCRRIRLHAIRDFSLPIPVELHMFDFKIGIHYRIPNQFYFAKVIKGAKNIGVSEQYMKMLLTHAPIDYTLQSKL